MVFRKRKKELLPVRFCGDPVLRRQAAPVLAVTPEIRTLAEQMERTMFENDIPGIGLAAPQVGVPIRLIVLGLDPDSGGDDGEDEEGAAPPPPRRPLSPGELLLLPRMPMALINPEIVWKSPETSVVVEGCLSIPEINGPVERPARILLRASTLDGESFTLECGGLLGRCLQHEIDHLDGVLFVDRLKPEDRAKVEARVAELTARTEEVAAATHARSLREVNFRA